VIEKEFDGFFMKTAYRHPGKPVPPGTAVDPAQMNPVQDLRIKSLITEPFDEAQLAPGPVKIRGNAWSGSEPVVSVEVSVDRGRTWQKAVLGKDQARYGWRLWEMDWTPQETGHYVILARAFDRGGKTQPLVQEWNPSGYQHNVVHQIAVEVTSKPQKPEAAEDAQAGAEKAEFAQPRGFKTACLTCHEEDVIMQQRLSRTQWEREVDKMIRWGAKVDKAERDAMIDYLLKLYGPRPLK
jgi:hypothetical protein